MKILLATHCRLEQDRGASGACLALGAALSAVGCEVEYFGFDQAFAKAPENCLKHSLRFPWWLAAFLLRHGRSFDVIDCLTGDAWLWATIGRPGGRRSSALITRSQGLEHVFDIALSQSGEHLSWKYPIYHGGFRLWEVERSIRLSDHCVLTNSGDRDYVRERFRVSTERLSVIPNGIADHFHRETTPKRFNRGSLNLVFIGTWIQRKGVKTVIEAVRALHDRNVSYRLTLLGTGGNGCSPLTDFPDALRGRIEVIPSYRNIELPTLLENQDVLLFPSLSEGFSLALVEAMSCGVVPIATPVGGAPSLIEHGANGFMVSVGDVDAIVRAVVRLSGDQDALANMGRMARQTSEKYRWDQIAVRTKALYSLILDQKRKEGALRRGRSGVM